MYVYMFVRLFGRFHTSHLIHAYYFMNDTALPIEESLKSMKSSGKKVLLLFPCLKYFNWHSQCSNI